MDNVNELRAELCSRFGPESDLVIGQSAGVVRCVLAIVLQPCTSKEKTEHYAWSLMAEAAEWLVSHQHELGSPQTAEIMVALPAAVRKIKRRIFRVGGSIDQWQNKLRTNANSIHGKGSYTYHYNEWANGIESWT